MSADSLSDLPRYLRANGHRVIATLAEEHLVKVAAARASLTAVLHQLEHGEASGLLDNPEAGFASFASLRDLAWCREEIKEALRSLASPKSESTKEKG